MMATDSPPDEATNPRVRPQVDKCDCFIRFEDIHLVLDGTTSAFDGEYTLNVETTNINCTNGCGVVHAFYSNSSCYNAGFCETDFSNQNPLSFFDFNCLVERNGSDTYSLEFYGEIPNFVNPCVGNTALDADKSFISFRIICSESSPDPNCRYGQGYSFISDLFIVDNFTDIFGSILGNTQFEIAGECGCTAVKL